MSHHSSDILFKNIISKGFGIDACLSKQTKSKIKYKTPIMKYNLLIISLLFCFSKTKAQSSIPQQSSIDSIFKHFPRFFTDTINIGRAMIYTAVKEPELNILYNKDINELAKK